MEASSTAQSDSVSLFDVNFSLSITRFLTVSKIPLKNLNKVDFPAPVGITITIHNNIGSSQSFPNGFTTACEEKYEININKPEMTAVAGTLRAFPIWAEP